MKKLRKIIRQNVATLPKQSVTTMKVALGIRAQSATLMALSLVMITQVIGVIIFTGNAQANGSVTLAATITKGLGESLQGPTALAMAPDDSFYVNFPANKITKYNSSNVAISVFGGTGTGDGQFTSGVVSMAVDKAGDLFAYDGARVQKFDSDGNFITKWGSYGTGDGQFGGGGSYGSPQTNAISIAPNGDVYVADLNNDRIQVFDTTGVLLRKLTQVGTLPRSIAVDRAGRMWVCSQPDGYRRAYTLYGQRIGEDEDLGAGGCFGALAVTPSGEVVTITGGNNGSKTNLDNQTVAYWTLGISKFNSMAVNSAGKIYITDYANDRILVYNDTSVSLQAVTLSAANLSKQSVTLNGSASINGVSPNWVTNRGFQIGTTTNYELPSISDTSATSALIKARGVGRGTEAYQVSQGYNFSIDPNGNYFVSENKDPLSGDYSVKKFGPTGTTFLGGVGAAGNGNGLFQKSWKSAFDSQGNIYIVDAGASPTRRIQKFTSSGIFVTSWGSAGSGDGQFQSASAIAIDSRDNVYVSDPSLKRIQKFDSTGNFVTKWGASGTGPGQFTAPSDIAVGADDTVYVLNAAGNKGVQHFTNTGIYLSQISSGGSNDNQILNPEGLAVSGNDIYIIDDRYQSGDASVVKKFNNSGDYLGSLHLKREDGSLARAFDIKINSIGDLVALVPDSITQVIYTYKTNQQTITGTFTNIQCGTTYHYRAYATNVLGTHYGDDQTFVACTPMQITTASLPDGDLAQPYTALIETNIQGPGSINASVTAGAMPTGLTLDPVTGEISGAPTQAGTFIFTVKVTDGSSYDTGSDERQFYLYVSGENLAVAPNNLYGNVGSSFGYQVQTTGGIGGAVTYSIDGGSLPPGLSISGTGLISGTPSSVGSFNVTLEAVQGIVTARGDITINISANAITIYGGTLPRGQIDTPYTTASIASTVYYGFGPKTYMVAGGTLPPGLSLDADGVLHGTPTTAGNYTFVVEVTDLTGSASDEFTLKILPPSDPRANTPIVTIASPPENTVFDYQNDDVLIAGTGPANQTIAIYMDGYELGTAVADQDGNWSYVEQDVFPGFHSVEARWNPPKNIAFVASTLISDMSGEVRMIDSAAHRVIKTIKLPQNSVVQSSTINNSGDKVYFAGYDVATYKYSIWEFDTIHGVLNRTAALDQLPAANTNGAAPIELIIMPDDQYAYINLVNAQNYPSFAIEVYKVELSGLSVPGGVLSVPVSPDDSSTMAANLHSAIINNNLYLPFSNQQTGTADMTIINLINQSISSSMLVNQSRASYYSRLISESGGDIYSIINGKIIRFDPSTNSIVSQATIDELGGGNQPISLAVDATHNKAYVGLQNDKVFAVDITSGDVTVITLTGTSPYTYYPMGLDLADDDSELYITTMYGNIYALNTQTDQLVSAANLLTSEYTKQVASLGNFVGAIQSPRASTSFMVEKNDIIVPSLPTCETCEPKSDPQPQLEEPTVTNVTPFSKSPVVTSAIRTKQPSPVIENSLFALAKRIPEPFAIGFPWLLLLLALVLVAIQYHQVRSESIATKRLQQSLARQRHLVEEQNNFVALSTHYLHTPLTVMEGEISLMVKAGTITEQEATKLRATLSSLSAEAEATLAQEEQNG